jgi:hypothetical protein
MYLHVIYCVQITRLLILIIINCIFLVGKKKNAAQTLPAAPHRHVLHCYSCIIMLCLCGFESECT